MLQPHFPGIGRYAGALLGALARVEPSLRLSLLTEPRARRLDLPGARWLDAPPIFSPLSQLWLPVLARQSGADLFHAPYYLYPYALPLPTLVTLHDLIPLDYPNMIPPGWGRRLYRPLNWLAARRAAHIVTDSEGARAAILRHLRPSQQKVSVIHAAPDPFFSADPTVERERFFFTLISNKPHKNGARLIRAFARSEPAAHGARLLLAGPTDPDWPSFQQQAQEAGVSEWVTVLGHLPEEALREHYRRCLAFVFPSFIEGFGLPALEAMACAAPTLVADALPMRDLVGEDALRFDPFDESDLTLALHRLLDDSALRHTLARQGHARAATFTWERSAREMLTLYRKVLSEW